MARKSTATITAPPAHVDEAESDLLIFEEADEFLTNRAPAPMEEVQAKVKEAQEELLQLRLRQEEIQRQQEQLELIRQKQERFARGKRELLEKLGRAATAIESELYNTQKLVEELSIAEENANRHLEVLRGLQPEKWQRSQVDEELDIALAAIDEARADFAKSNRRLDALRPAPEQVEAASAGVSGLAFGPDDLQTWLKRGAAFIAAPLLAAIIIGLLFAKLLF
jgi:chromosome segregation ATPase